MSFIYTRVQCPTKGDWGKFRRVLNYLKVKKDDKRIVGFNDLLKLDTWIDASHAVHDGMSGHTGGCTSCGVLR